MDKVFTRITIVLVAIYFIVSYIIAQYFGVDVLYNSYILLFELCVVTYTFCSGKFHCRFMRWTTLSIFLCELISHLDYYFDFLNVAIYNIIPLSILLLGIGTSITLALRHFYKVNQLRNKRNK